ncbi:radical SAM protein [Nocardioides luteus]|uniref:Radical SAM protein n=1 Tax=Nocardioides luteus TaxID=1844 RepID=A0A1J4N3Q7_9ACTN|nr:TIGR03936 family radical SAM-associated protein [Nocardioides luteus]OIJ26155.1 radical SAM protein [Nocardioides luteus]
MRQQPEQQAPPVQRLRIRYAKRGRLRFTSHRDFSRAFERAVARARIPVAYSSGFNPHPRISYAGAAPTGAASEAEYVELALREVVDPVATKGALDEVMPDGLDLLDVVDTATSPKGALADLLTGSEWIIDLPTAPEEAAAAVAAFLAAEEVIVERMTKKGMREFDARSAVVRLASAPRGEGGSRLELLLKHGTPTVRPDDVVTGLERIGGLKVGPEHGGLPLLTRLTQGTFDEESGTIGDPLH